MLRCKVQSEVPAIVLHFRLDKVWKYASLAHQTLSSISNSSCENAFHLSPKAIRNLFQAMSSIGVVLDEQIYDQRLPSRRLIQAVLQDSNLLIRRQ